jgi:hypothetical protein
LLHAIVRARAAEAIEKAGEFRENRRMVIHYYLAKNSPLTVEIPDFQAFRAWLEGFGVASGKPGPKTLEGWAETYRSLAAEGLEGELCFGRPAERYEKVLYITGVDK